MKKRIKILLVADFNYSKYSIVKKVTAVLFVACCFVGIVMVLNFVTYLFGETEYDMLVIVSSFILGWYILGTIFEKLYKKLFSKRVKIIMSKGYITLWINEEERMIRKRQIRDIKAKVCSRPTRYGGRAMSTKLIIYTDTETFHFTSGEAVYEVEKLLKVVPN
ncbi:hypothetical protein [Candidatus Enterococcus mansonii]|uniref:Uncharacterized protein n=1 Tax=Candidatus Enterococcus mansonii TaxID=1834181 RepID=A0A242C6R6_9ENTE|nr:hypothetical protein [Enterococcus sp. 4G2_DIV0659]OTO05798.1 hypothetical protein A5880_002973 [Enterococcus sp. 4G2_DIV0659]